MVSYDCRGERRLPPPDQDVEPAFSDGDDHARHPRAPVENDLEVSEPEGGPRGAVVARHVDQEPGLALEIWDDEPFER